MLQDLTVELHRWLAELLEPLDVHTVGVELDDSLVQCAKTKYRNSHPKVCLSFANAYLETPVAYGGDTMANECSYTEREDCSVCCSLVLFRF